MDDWLNEAKFARQMMPCTLEIGTNCTLLHSTDSTLLVSYAVCHTLSRNRSIAPLYTAKYVEILGQSPSAHANPHVQMHSCECSQWQDMSAVSLAQNRVPATPSLH